MEDRVVLVILAIHPVPRVITGSTNALHPSEPPDGNHRKCREKPIISISPSQKLGVATPKRANTMLILSIREYCLVAEIIPIGMDSTMANTIPQKASFSVSGNLDITSLNTERPDL